MFAINYNIKTEQHELSAGRIKRTVNVWRCDEAPMPPLSPYVKMVELEPFVQHVAEQGIKSVGYYATMESEWTPGLVRIGQAHGLTVTIGLSKLKSPPFFATELESLKALHLLRPNMYSINKNLTAQRVRALAAQDAEAYMIPMGVDHPRVPLAMAEFLRQAKLPRADHYIVPAGSGVTTAGIIKHLRWTYAHSDKTSAKDKKKWPLVHIVCTRHVDSVKEVVERHNQDALDFVRSVALYHAAPELLAVDRLPGYPWPMHLSWELCALKWLRANLGKFDNKSTVMYMNLGR